MSTPSATLSEWKYPLVILCAVVLVYVQTLSFDFVNYDDPDLVSQNGEFLSNPANALAAFTTHAFTSHREESAYYRPLLLVSFIADYQIWQLNPLGFHLTNVIIHALAAVLLFRLLQRIARDELVALGGSLLFAMHPLQTESVAWIAGRNDALVGLFIVMMMYFYAAQDDRPEHARRSLALAALSFLLALFTKESAAFFIVLPAAYELVVRKARVRALVTGPRRLFFLAQAAILAGYFLIRLALFGEFIGAERLYGVIAPGTRLTMVPAMLAEHLLLIVAPVALCVVHPLADIFWLNDPWTYAAYAVAVLCLVALRWAWKNDRTACFGLVWLAVGLVPVLNIFPVAVPILEHRLYASVAGLGLAVASVLRRKLPGGDQAFRVVMGVLIVAATGASFLRTPVWRDSEALWTDAIAKAPSASRAYFNLAGFYFEKQQYDKTIGLMDTYVRIKPDDMMGYVKLRQTLLLAGRFPEANAVSRKMIALNPHNPNRYIEAGMLYERFNMPDSAIGIYLQGIAADTSFYQLHARLGTVYEALGDQGRANKWYLDAIRLIEEGAKNYHPPSETIALLKYLYERTGQTEKARALSAQ
jgi:tetratricopeptide (TPR) repeat protein